MDCAVASNDGTTVTLTPKAGAAPDPRPTSIALTWADTRIAVGALVRLEIQIDS